jgi:hypothetical protein
MSWANRIASIQSAKKPVSYELLRLRDLEANYGHETGKYVAFARKIWGKTTEISAGIISAPIEIRPRYIPNARPTHQNSNNVW